MQLKTSLKMFAQKLNFTLQSKSTKRPQGTQVDNRYPILRLPYELVGHGLLYKIFMDIRTIWHFLQVQEVLTHRGFSGERKNRDKRNPR